MSHRFEPLAVRRVPRHRLPSWAAWLGLVAIASAVAYSLGGRLATAGVASAPVELEAQLEALQGALAAEQQARESLALELAALEAQTHALEAQLGVERRAAAPGSTARPEASAREPDGGVESAEALAPRAPLFDVDALVASCMSRRDAETLRARWERYELERLQLNDRAMRLGYFMRPRHGLEHAALDAAFREEVGDDGYDAFLRATGKPNRVAVREVLPSGAGRVAGFEVGDQFERYDGLPVFSNADLQLLTASGRLGETVDVEVVRGGHPLTLRAARGPLGVVLDGVVRAPEGGC
jgi:hypothetical protein